MVRFFCPACWAAVPPDATVCPVCGADLAALDAEPFDVRLARALWSPEPDTARLAAEVLGRRRSAGAVPELVRRLRAGTDPYLGAEIAVALGRIGGPPARAALEELSRHDSVVVRAAARRALGALDSDSAPG